MKEIYHLVAPFIISAAAGQVNLMVERTLATGLPPGTVSALYFANKLVFLPQGIFTAAVGMVVFPLLVKTASEHDWSGVIESIYRASRLLVLILLPAIAGLYLLRFPIVEHGAFTPYDTQVTAGTIPYFLGALLFNGMVSILVSVYFATKKMAVAVGTGVTALFLNIALSLWLIGPLQQRGLALANSLSALLNMALLIVGFFYFLRLQEKTSLPLQESKVFLIKVGFSVLGMSLLLWGFKVILNPYAVGRLGNALLVLSGVAIGFICYFSLLYFARVEEVCQGVSCIKAFFNSKTVPQSFN